MGIAFWLRISKLLVPVLKNSKVVLFIANSTYYIMIHHFLGFMSIKTIFAFLNYFIGLFPDFNWIEYKTNIWYYYLPFGLSCNQYACCRREIKLPFQKILVITRSNDLRATVYMSWFDISWKWPVLSQRYTLFIIQISC